MWLEVVEAIILGNPEKGERETGNTLVRRTVKTMLRA